MKKLAFMALATVAALSISCKQVCPDPQPTPDQPGNEDPDTPDEPAIEYISLEHAMSAYYGDYFKHGSNDYYIQLYTGEVDDWGYFKGACTSITFDLMTERSAVMDLPEGTYTPADNYAAGTFEIGVDVTWRQKLENEAASLNKIFGTSDYTVESLMPEYGITADQLEDMIYDSGADFFVKHEDESYIDRAISNGTIKVSKDGDNYCFLLDFSIDGEQYHYKYEGTMSMRNDSGESVDPDEPDVPQGDINFEGVYAQATNYGPAWGDAGVSVDHNSWSILAYTTDQSAGGEFIELDFITNSGVGKNIPDGTYPIVEPQAANIKPGVAVGYYEEYGYGFGCWYGKNQAIVHEGNSGNVTISHKNDGSLLVTFSMTETSSGKTIAGSVSGTIDYFDYSTTSATKAQAPGKIYKKARMHHENIIRK